MYDLVAGIQCLKSSYVLSKTRALELFPMLKKDRLVGAIVYYDGESVDCCLSSVFCVNMRVAAPQRAPFCEVVCFHGDAVNGSPRWRPVSSGSGFCPCSGTPGF